MRRRVLVFLRTARNLINRSGPKKTAPRAPFSCASAGGYVPSQKIETVLVCCGLLPSPIVIVVVIGETGDPVGTLVTLTAPGEVVTPPVGSNVTAASDAT